MNKLRGKCKEMSEQACKDDPRLTLVRGYYYCPISNREEQHWWCKDEDGMIVDATKSQFPSNGHGDYREFDGYVQCEQCGKTIAEEHIIPMGRFPCCSDKCACLLVGVSNE